MPVRLAWLVILFIIVQSALIWFLSARIYTIWQSRTAAKDSAIIPFTQDSLSRPETDLPGFYEPKPDTVNEIEPAWLGKKVLHHINHDGLRDLHDYTEEKPDNVFRIAVMGDSFTYGLFVDDGETYPEKLETILNTPRMCSSAEKVEVINFGVPGYDVEMSAHRYGYRIARYQPDLVLWYIIENDFSEYSSFVQDLWLNFKQMLIAENIPYEKFAPETAEILSSVVTGRLGESFVPIHQEKKLQQWVGRMDVPFVIFTDMNMPQGYQDAIGRAVSQNTKGRYLRAVNYSNAFSEGHPSPNSYTMIADTLFSYLKRERLIPCDDTVL